MTTIFANRYFFPDQSATSRMVSSLAFALAKEGQPVSVIASRHWHDKTDAELPHEEIIDGVRVYRIATTRFGRRHLPGRAIDYLTYHLSAALKLWQLARRGDIAVICTDPPLLSVSAALPLRLRGAKLINWIMDLFPEVAIDLGMVSGSGPLARGALAVRDWSLRTATVNACPMDGMAKYLASRGIAPDRLVVEQHWSDGTEIHPVPRADNRLRRAWGYRNELVVGYSGNFGRAHEFDTIIDAAERLRARADVRFLLIGDGQKRPAVEAEIMRRGLTNVTFKPLQPRELLAESLSVADLHLVSLLPALERSIVPSKLYGILAAGRGTVFVGDRKGEVATVIDVGNCGVTVPIGAGEQLAGVITALADDPAQVQQLGHNARALFEARYTSTHGVSAWRQLLNSLSTKTLVPTAATTKAVPS